MISDIHAFPVLRRFRSRLVQNFDASTYENKLAFDELASLRRHAPYHPGFRPSEWTFRAAAKRTSRSAVSSGAKRSAKRSVPMTRSKLLPGSDAAPAVAMAGASMGRGTIIERLKPSTSPPSAKLRDTVHPRRIHAETIDRPQEVDTILPHRCGPDHELAFGQVSRNAVGGRGARTRDIATACKAVTTIPTAAALRPEPRGLGNGAADRRQNGGNRPLDARCRPADGFGHACKSCFRDSPDALP